MKNIKKGIIERDMAEQIPRTWYIKKTWCILKRSPVLRMAYTASHCCHRRLIMALLPMQKSAAQVISPEKINLK